MCGNDDFEVFLKVHEPQIACAGIPRRFLPALFRKLKNEILDAGDTFQIIPGDDEHPPRVVVVSDTGVRVSDVNQIYLIDHAWVFESHKARTHLTTVPGLLERMRKLMNLKSDDSVETVESELWKYNQTYSICSETEIENQTPVWYVMDEFGSAIRHSDEPNFQMVPFIYAPSRVSFTLLFPLRDIVKGEEVCRDYVNGVTNNLLKKALLFPWNPVSFRNIDYRNIEVCDKNFFQGRSTDTLPVIGADFINEPDNNRIFTVYSEYKYINDYLTHPNFKIVSDPESADILWYSSHFKDFKKLSLESPHKFINQFPYENVITVKDLLFCICRNSKANHSSCPNWLLTTYNLETELPQFISYFQSASSRNSDNFWICKPWNLARGLDMHITDNLNCIIRLSTSGPKIAQKYVTNPVLFYRQGIGKVKFDIRYVILLKSVNPLKVYAYRNFFLRFANKPFGLTDLDDYEKHFTVMNYSKGMPLCKMLCSDFVAEFESQYPQYEWRTIELKIFKMLREMLNSACSRKPPCGIAPNPQSRAFYGVDIMLAEEITAGIEPKLLEVNWLPDCQRACEYYPNFYNDIFSQLFLNDDNENMCPL